MRLRDQTEFLIVLDPVQYLNLALIINLSLRLELLNLLIGSEPRSTDSTMSNIPTSMSYQNKLKAATLKQVEIMLEDNPDFAFKLQKLLDHNHGRSSFSASQNTLQSRLDALRTPRTLNTTPRADIKPTTRGGRSPAQEAQSPKPETPSYARKPTIASPFERLPAELRYKIYYHLVLRTEGHSELATAYMQGWVLKETVPITID